MGDSSWNCKESDTAEQRTKLHFTQQWEECCQCLVCADIKYPSLNVTSTKYKMQGWEAAVSAQQRPPKSFKRQKAFQGILKDSGTSKGQESVFG